MTIDNWTRPLIVTLWEIKRTAIIINSFIYCKKIHYLLEVESKDHSIYIYTYLRASIYHQYYRVNKYNPETSFRFPKFSRILIFSNEIFLEKIDLISKRILDIFLIFWYNERFRELLYINIWNSDRIFTFFTLKLLLQSWSK